MLSVSLVGWAGVHRWRGGAGDSARSVATQELGEVRHGRLGQGYFPLAHIGTYVGGAPFDRYMELINFYLVLYVLLYCFTASLWSSVFTDIFFPNSVERKKA